MRLPDRGRGRGERRALAILGRALLAHAVNADVGAERRQPLGERPPEAAAGAGDQSDLPGERAHSLDHRPALTRPA